MGEAMVIDVYTILRTIFSKTVLRFFKGLLLKLSKLGSMALLLLLTSTFYAAAQSEFADNNQYMVKGDSSGRVLLAYELIPKDPSNPNSNEIGSMAAEPIFLEPGRPVKAYNIHWTMVLNNNFAGVDYATPGTVIMYNGKRYVTDARYIYNKDVNKTIFEIKFDQFQRSLGAVSGYSTDKLHYVDPISYNLDLADGGYKGPRTQTPSPAQADTGIEESASSAPVETSSSGSDTPGNSLGVNMFEEAIDPPPADTTEGSAASDTSGASADTPAETVSETETPSSTDGTATETASAPIPRPVPRPTPVGYSESVRDGILLQTSDAVQGRIIKRGDQPASGNFDLPKAQRLKIVPYGKKEDINGEVWREVEYTFGLDRLRLMVPQSKLLTTDGPLTEDTVIEISNQAAAVGGGAGDSAAVDETSDQTSAAPSEESAGTAATTDHATAESATAVGTCSNPDYLTTLTDGNPNCRLVRTEKLLRSRLAQGDVVLAMDKNNKSCYKISVDTVSYSDDRLLNQEIEAATKERKESYDSISRFLQNGHEGFISHSEPQRNRYTLSCHDRTKVCSVGFGFEAAERMRHVKSFSTPSVGFDSNPAKDFKIEIYGPNSTGHYMVRHLKGSVWGRAFLVKDRSKISEAIRMMDKHTSDFANLSLSDEDKARTFRNKPVLYVQKHNTNGELQTTQVNLDPAQPFKAIADLNRKYDYYHMSCQGREYNPLTEPNGWSSPAPADQPVDGVE